LRGLATLDVVGPARIPRLVEDFFEMFTETPVFVGLEYGEVIERLAAGQTLGSLDEQLAGLPESQRDALELRVVHELDYEEIGQRLAISPEGARTRVFRALATLRAQIGRSA